MPPDNFARRLPSRGTLVRALRNDAPRDFFLELGAPSSAQLRSHVFDPPARRQLQSRFESYIWKAEFLRAPSIAIKFWGAVVVVSHLAVIVAWASCCIK